MSTAAGKGNEGKGAKGSFPDRLAIPAEVLAIAETLEAAGFETWCVGGAVRDTLLDQPNADFDLATAAPPAEVRKRFRRTVPIGIEHGTVAVLDDQNHPHEVTTFRRDVKTDGRHAVVEFGVSLDDDLARRDFTINAIAYHPITHAWRDPFRGHADLAAGVVRAVGDPSQRFREDYLRILRALRFAARFGFAVEPATMVAAKAEADGLKGLSAERVRDEWFKGIKTARLVSGLLDAWREVGAVRVWLRELGDGQAGQGSAGVDGLGHDPVLVTAFLSDDPAATLARLKCSNVEIERGRRIGAFRDRLPDGANLTAVRRWMAAVGPAVDDLLLMAQAQPAGGGTVLAAAVDATRRSGAALDIGALAVTGDDVMAAGVTRGPAVGQVLRALLERVLDDPGLNTRERLLALVPTVSGTDGPR